MKIAILADPLDTQSAGIHVYTRELIKAMLKADKKNIYLIIRAKKGQEDFGNVAQVIVPIQSFPPMHLRWRQLFVIPKILRQKGVDIVIEPAHFGPFNLPKSVKRVTVIHDLTPILFPQFHGFLSTWMHKLLLPRVLRKADLVITNSEHTRSDVEQYFPFTKGKTKAIVLGKDESFFPQKDLKILEKYGITAPYFLCVGTIEPRKNVGLLLAAFEGFKRRAEEQQLKTNFQLVFAGKKGWQMDDFYQKVEASPFRSSIVFTGYFEQEDLPVLYSMTKCMVYPSHYEGFGLPVLEAMTCAAPVITSKVSSLPEVGGMAALYFDGQSEKDLSDLLWQVATNEKLCHDLSQKSLKQAVKFSWKKVGEEMVEVLNKV